MPQVAPLPTPPRQTPAQLRLITAIAREAARASAAARPMLLRVLGSAGFEAALGGCCPALQVRKFHIREHWRSGYASWVVCYLPSMTGGRT